MITRFSAKFKRNLHKIAQNARNLRKGHTIYYKGFTTSLVTWCTRLYHE